MKHRKGISPLVAVVMLIAFTLLVAGILGAMVTQFTQQQRASIQYCTGAKALILSGVYQTANSDLTLNIHNFGDVDLSFTVLLTAINGTVSKVAGDVLVPEQDIVQFTFGTDLAQVQEVTIQSQECPGVQDLVRGDTVKVI